MLSSLDIPIVKFVESSGCIKKALLKWSAVINQKHSEEIKMLQSIFDSHNFL